LHQISEALVLPDVSQIEQIQQQAVFAEQAAESAHFARWMQKPMAAIDQVTESWSVIVRLWKEMRAFADVTALQEFQDTSELKSLIGLSVQCNDLLALQNSIEHLESTLILRRDLKESGSELTEIDTQLAAAQEEARKGLCPKCGRAVEHICQ
jgi:hypothetical protein